MGYKEVIQPIRKMKTKNKVCGTACSQYRTPEENDILTIYQVTNRSSSIVDETFRYDNLFNKQNSSNFVHACYKSKCGNANACNF